MKARFVVRWSTVASHQRCRIPHLAQPLIVECRGEEMLDQVGHHLAARPVTHHDGRVVLQRARAGPAQQVGFICHGCTLGSVECLASD